MNTAAVIPEMTDAQREEHIRDCGQRMEVAMAAGNRQEAVEWMQAQKLAISQRSPEQMALLIAKEERRLDEGLDYFAKAGQQHAKDILCVRDQS